jgi:hypothetical protein
VEHEIHSVEDNKNEQTSQPISPVKSKLSIEVNDDNEDQSDTNND